jgi:hypothetical protein
LESGIVNDDGKAKLQKNEYIIPNLNVQDIISQRKYRSTERGPSQKSSGQISNNTIAREDQNFSELYKLQVSKQTNFVSVQDKLSVTSA